MRLRRSPRARARRRPLAADEPPKPVVGPPPTPSDQYRRPVEAAPPSGGGPGHSWLQRLGVFVLSIVILASAINALSLSTDTKIEFLNSTGSRSLMRPAEVYQAAATRQLGSSIWSRNKITVNTAALSRQLMAQFPELSNVNVTVPLLAHRPVVYLTTAQPVLILSTSNGAFVIGDTGKALVGGPSPASLNRSNLPVLTDQSGLRIQINRQALPVTSVGFIQVVAAQLAAKQFAVSGMTLPPAASELDVHLAGQPYLIKFNLENDQPREQVGTFLATITQLRHQNVTPSQYVDVRVPGRAYYK